MVVLLSITMAIEEGPGVFLSSTYWALVAVFAVIALLVGIGLRYGFVTQEQVRRRVDAIRTKRAGHPRDLVRLAEASCAERRDWRRRTKRRVRRRIAVELVLAMPLAALLGYVVWRELGLLPNSMAGVWSTVTALVVLLLVLLRIHRYRKDPLLLVARVVGGVDGVAISFVESPTLKGQLLTWLEYGHARTIHIEIVAASDLAPDGALCARPDWRGRREVGVSRRALRHLIEGERCVLLCSGAGTVVDRLGDLA